MKKFYHVDAIRNFNKNDIIYPIKKIELENLGYYNLSKHGITYLFTNSNDGFYELMYELIRSKFYNNRLSRLESIFAFETKEEAIMFAKKYRSNYRYQIIELESHNYEILDMNWLTGGIGLDLYNKCLCYWKGEFTSIPIKECLLKLPVKVNEIVYESK